MSPENESHDPEEAENSSSEKEDRRMHITKRNGTSEPADVNKIVKSIERSASGLDGVDPLKVATSTISALYDGATTTELDEQSIRTAASLSPSNPNYSKLAARMLLSYVDKEVESQNVHSFSQSIRLGYKTGLVNKPTADFVAANARKLDHSIIPSRNRKFEFFGARVVYDRYLLRHPDTRKAIETHQQFWMRVACGLTESVADALAFYKLMSALAYLPSSPTLFNSGTVHQQLSSCYLLDSPEDDLKSIYDKYTDVALLSKFAGGIGLSYSRVRSNGSLIRGTNGKSNGIVPWLKTLDSSVSAVNQGGRRKGAACIYLETWHADIEDFLELRSNTGSEARRTYNLNLANWVPDMFMRRAFAEEEWSLFDPKDVPHLTDLYGEEFDKAYEKAEADGLAKKTVPASQLYSRMMLTLAATGNGWITFKDASNLKSNQTGENGNTIHLSNLCTEILEVTSKDETAVCNLGSVNLSEMVEDGDINFKRLQSTVLQVVPFLDRVIDINFYPIDTAAASNAKWRPVGLGVMGLQDVYFKLGMPFESDEAKNLGAKIFEEIYYAALLASCRLAEKHGAHPGFPETKAAKGSLQYDLWGVKESALSDPDRWKDLKKQIKEHGLRNSLLVAVAPTATIASIAGCYECIEPQTSNLFKRETLSGDFLQINKYLVEDLQKENMWNDEILEYLKHSDGSIQNIPDVAEALKEKYRTAWEISMRKIIDMAAARGPFIDQSQSLNLFAANPETPKLNAMYKYAWEQGLKTTYYLRSRAATSINKTSASSELDKEFCSLENPEICDACQ